jgi:hypothetical protein
LLEAMQERQVTIGEYTYPLDEPFLVLATQNPIEQEGTYPLPEAQVDRFMLKVVITYPDRREEREIMERMTRDSLPPVHPVISPEAIVRAKGVSQIYVDEKIKDYVLDIVFATRQPEKFDLADLKPLMGLVAVVLFFAWRRGWPLWSASWYGYGTWTAMALISFVISRLDEDWRYTNALFLGWIGLCIIGYFYLFSKDRLKALLAVAFLFPMLGIMFLEFVPSAIEGWLAIGLGLLTTLTAAAIVRLGDFPIGLRLALGVNLVICLWHT